MGINANPKGKKDFWLENDACNEFKTFRPSFKKGCMNLIEVTSFFLVFLIVLFFVTFCQRQEETTRSAMHAISKIVIMKTN